MGVGKTFEMIGISNLFSDNPEQFASNIGKVLQCNIELITYDWATDETDGEVKHMAFSKMINIGFEKSEKVFVDYEIDDKLQNTGKLLRYGIEICLNNQKLVDDVLDLEFYPYGAVCGFLPTATGTWDFLYRAIIGKLDISYNYHIEQVKDLYVPRKLYRQILLDLGISEIVMFTDNYYKFEEELWDIVQTQSVESIHDIVSLAKELDKLHVFDFISILKDSADGELSSEFLDCDAYQIIFIDNLKNQINV
ncbi:MAG: hypothetical protein PHF99_12535 [Bacteroidales bacterium]|nr:hypothetical protein [Bacteroidales bacterium]